MGHGIADIKAAKRSREAQTASLSAGGSDAQPSLLY